MSKIILLCGESGSGKTTVANFLEEVYGLKQLQSYTTRPPRTENEQGHIFISEEEFDKIPPDDMVAYTKYNGYRYCGTTQQVEESDVYVIDLPGIDYFRRNYKGNKHPLVIYLSVPAAEREARMKSRGDSAAYASERLEYDDTAFKDAKYTVAHIFENEDSRLTAQAIRNLFMEDENDR